jgi:hypothetical protein
MSCISTSVAEEILRQVAPASGNKNALRCTGREHFESAGEMRAIRSANRAFPPKPARFGRRPCSPTRRSPANLPRPDPRSNADSWGSNQDRIEIRPEFHVETAAAARMRRHRRNETATSRANRRSACRRSADQSRSLARSRRTDLPTSRRQSREARQPEALRDPGLVAYPAFLVALLNTISKKKARRGPDSAGEVVETFILTRI